MASINKVTLIGNLGNDPEYRQLKNGRSVANFSVATSESWKNKNTGDWEEDTQWHRVTCFGQRADYIAKYAHKGIQVYLEGKLKTRRYTDRDGLEKFITEIIVDAFSGQITILTQKDKRAELHRGYGPKPKTPQETGPTEQKQDFDQDFGDDIPF